MAGGHHPRSSVEHRAEVVPVAPLGLPGRDPHPHRQLQLPLCRDRGVDRRSRRGKRGNHAVTGMAEQETVVRLIEERSTSSCAITDVRIAAASASHRRVDPSISVNRNVTTPDGAVARSADTSAESHNRQLLPRTSADPARSHAGKAWRSAILAGRITAAIWHMLGSTR